CCAPSSPWSASTTTACGCTQGSATSPPTTSTRAVVRRSARPAKPDSSRPGCGASPTIAPTALPTRPSTPSTTCPRSPAMLANRSGICIANSETAQAGGAVGLGVQYGMLDSYGFGAGAAASAIAIVSLFNVFATLVMPVVGVVALLASGVVEGT